MQDDIIIQISNKIKEKRKDKNITIQELANRAEVSKGLISQIENSRTIPSLPVLLNIIRSLNLDLNEFFTDFVGSSQSSKVVIKRPADYRAFEKEMAKGFHYKRILTKSIKNFTIDIVLLELEAGASRHAIVKTDAYEYKYIIKGKVEYVINHKTHELNEGDSLFFDGRLGHKPANIGDDNALILVVYFFDDKL